MESSPIVELKPALPLGLVLAASGAFYQLLFAITDEKIPAGLIVTPCVAAIVMLPHARPQGAAAQVK